MALAVESPNDFSPRDRVFIRNPLSSSQHMLPEEKKVASGIIIHRLLVFLDGCDTFNRVS